MVMAGYEDDFQEIDLAAYEQHRIDELNRKRNNKERHRLNEEIRKRHRRERRWRWVSGLFAGMGEIAENLKPREISSQERVLRDIRAMLVFAFLILFLCIFLGFFAQML